jgi:hypothetical protein
LANGPFTFWTGNDGAALIGPFFDLAILADGFGERADLEEAHEHRVVTGAVEARLVGDDPVTFAVVLEHVVTSWIRTGRHTKDWNLIVENGGGKTPFLF